MQTHFFGLALAQLLLLSLGAPDARADIMITESNVPDLKVGTTLPGNPDLKVPKGGKVRVLLLPDYKTKLIEGPEDATGSHDSPFGGSRGPK